MAENSKEKLTSCIYRAPLENLDSDDNDWSFHLTNIPATIRNLVIRSIN